MMKIDEKKLMKIHEQSEEVTIRMLKNLKIYILREIDMLKRVNPQKYRGYNSDMWIRYIRYKMLPEWSALIDKNYNLRAFRYGFATDEMWFSKRCVFVHPKDYSIGSIHYHPRRVEFPSISDLSAFIYRYEKGERLFAIHTDYGTIFYIFTDKLRNKIPCELKSIGYQLFGYPRSVRINMYDWLYIMMREGIIVRKCIEDDRRKYRNKMMKKILFGNR